MKIPAGAAPQLWALVSTVLTVIGVSDPGMQAEVKSVIAGAGALVIAVWQIQHHRTVRNADQLAAALQSRKATATAAVAAARAPAPAPVLAGNGTMWTHPAAPPDGAAAPTMVQDLTKGAGS